MLKNTVLSRSQIMECLMICVLVIAVFVTSILVIYYKHFSRQLFSELQASHKLRDELHVEWTQLLLEQGAWASDSRVEKIAREKLQMHLPPSDKVVVIKE